MISKSIVVEGPDNTGKTSLAVHLARHLNLPMFRAGPSPDNKNLIFACCSYQLEWVKERPCIFDRVTPISHRCYREVDLEISRVLSETMKYIRPKIILVYCQKELGRPTRDTYENEEDEKKVASDKEIVRQNYTSMMYFLQPDIVYDGSLEDTVELIKALR